MTQWIIPGLLPLRPRRHRLTIETALPVQRRAVAGASMPTAGVRKETVDVLGEVRVVLPFMSLSCRCLHVSTPSQIEGALRASGFVESVEREVCMPTVHDMCGCGSKMAFGDGFHTDVVVPLLCGFGSTAVMEVKPWCMLWRTLW